MGSGAWSDGVAKLVHRSTQDVNAVDPPIWTRLQVPPAPVGGGYAKFDAPMGRACCSALRCWSGRCRGHPYSS